MPPTLDPIANPSDAIHVPADFQNPYDLFIYVLPPTYAVAATLYEVPGEPRYKGGPMNYLLSAIIAIAATMLLLLLREFILSVGKKGRSSFHRRSEGTVFRGSEVRLNRRPQAVPTAQFEQPQPDATPIEVDEFLAELRAKAGEHSSPSKRANGPESEFAGDSHHSKLVFGDWR
jgi:hypothetical protein